MKTSAKYLVCVDDNPSSHVALHFACKKAQKNGRQVKLVHVIAPEDVNNLFGVMNKIREEERQIAKAMVTTLVESCVPYGNIVPSVELREGRIGEEIINAIIEDSEVIMLILGAASQTSNNINLIQWLTEKLGDRILIPIMLVPGNLTDLQIDELL